MKLVNKTRYAILGMLVEGPATGYEIKSFMGRSTVYFWRESDSTLYPMLKTLSEEGKVVSESAYVGKKRKEIFSITEAGIEEFNTWLKSPTGEETPRNEFLLKLFFVTDRREMTRLLQERLKQVQHRHEVYKAIEERLQGLPDFTRKAMRLTALRYGLAQLASEMQWLRDEGQSKNDIHDKRQ